MKLLLFVIYKSYIFQKLITAINIVKFVSQYFNNIVIVLKIYL